MKIRIAIVLLLLIWCVTIPVTAQRSIDDEEVAALRTRSDLFISLVYEGSYADAFELVRSYPVAVTRQNLSSLQETVESQLDDIVNVYGAKLEAKYIGFNAVSDFLIRFIYVIRYEKHFLWWQLVYYRGAEDEWLLSSIAFDDDTKELMNQTF